MKSTNISTLGEAYIQHRIEHGINFVHAWDDWQDIQRKLEFIIHHPEVRYYDNHCIFDRNDRLRMRELAQSSIGEHIRSNDVSMLGNVAEWMQLDVPSRECHIDRAVVIDWLNGYADFLEMDEGISDVSLQIRQMASSDETVDDITYCTKVFAEDHRLWGVPPDRLVGIFWSYEHRLHNSGSPVAYHPQTKGTDRC